MVVTNETLQRNAKLMQVRATNRLLRFLFRARERRQKQRRNDDDDGDDEDHFDQRQATRRCSCGIQLTEVKLRPSRAQGACHRCGRQM